MIMQKFNYHTHTYRCKHAKGSDEEYVLKAIEAGYTVLGFSDHAPYRDYPSERSHMDFEQLDEYIESISYLKEKYKDQIEIHIGLETEYFPFNHDERAELGSKVEYLLLGQHYSDPVGKELNFFINNTDEEILYYGNSVCNALDTGLFLYLCHPDVFLTRQEEFSEACEKVAHMIARKLVELDIPAEINVHGSLRGKHMFGDKEYFYYPNKQFWSIMAQYPIRCLLGIDAHSPDQLMDFESVEMTLKELEDLNLNYIEKPFKF